MKIIISYIINLYFRLRFLRQIVWSIILFFFFLIIVLIAFQKRNISTKPVGWEKSFYISPLQVQVKNFKVASSGNYIALVYESRTEEKVDIYVSISFNGGKNFLVPIIVASLESEIDINPEIAVSNKGKLTVAWHKLVLDEATNRIFYSMSDDLGANWSKPRQAFIGFEMEMLPRVFYDSSGTLHLFFHAFKNSIFTLYHAVRNNEEKFGITGSLIELTREMKGAFFPSILFSRNNIFIVWQGKGADFTDDLFFMKSEDYGDSWSSHRKITESKANDASPSLILYGDTLYLAFRNNDNKNWEIKLLRGLGYGEVWETRPLKVSETNADCYSPKIEVSKNEIYITWYDSRDRTSKIFSRRYKIIEGKLKREMSISQGVNPARRPNIVSLGHRVIVFWEEGARIIGKFNDVYSAPPFVFSQSHPKNKWSRKSVAVIHWKKPEDESGIVGYAHVVTKPSGYSRIIDINPTIQSIRADSNKLVIPELQDGVTYLHIRSIDGAGNLSRTIHYRIQVSANPLPIPVVVSPTHPLGKAVKINSPVFRWAIEDTERLKGFTYNLSKDVVKEPDNFITDFEIKFENLEEGKYFFSLANIDKTNKKSSVAIYPFIVGSKGTINIDFLKRIAKDEVIKRKKISKVVFLQPELEVNYPFNVNEPFVKDNFNAIIVTRNIPRAGIAGYSISIDKNKNDFPNSVNLKGNILNVNNLKNGIYYLGVKCKYYKLVNNKRKYFWTKAFVTKFKIDVPVYKSPVEHYGSMIIKKLSDRIGAVSAILSGFIVLIMTMGFGTKILFFTRLINFRARVLFRMIF